MLNQKICEPIVNCLKGAATALNGCANAIDSSSQVDSLASRLAEKKSNWFRTYKSDFTETFITTKDNIIPVFDMKKISEMLKTDLELEKKFNDEINQILLEGPGFFYCKNAVPDDVCDGLKKTFKCITDFQKEKKLELGDSFGMKGAANRVWRAWDELAKSNPELFINFAKYEADSRISEAYLGPRVQYTAQLNETNPGAAAQSWHQDYMLGFETTTNRLKYPTHHQQFSKSATLQIGVALEDVSMEMGPTMLIPFTNTEKEPYSQIMLEDQALLEKLKVQEPLKKGSMIVFCPATTHAAGANQSDHTRSVLLFQNGTGGAKLMDSQDNRAMIKQVYPILLKQIKDRQITPGEAERVIKKMSNSFSYPTDSKLFLQQPGQTFPDSQTDIVLRALKENSDSATLEEKLDEIDKRNQGFSVVDMMHQKLGIDKQSQVREVAEQLNSKLTHPEQVVAFLTTRSEQLKSLTPLDVANLIKQMYSISVEAQTSFNKEKSSEIKRNYSNTLLASQEFKGYISDIQTRCKEADQPLHAIITSRDGWGEGKAWQCAALPHSKLTILHRNATDAEIKEKTRYYKLFNAYVKKELPVDENFSLDTLKEAEQEGHINEDQATCDISFKQYFTNDEATNEQTKKDIQATILEEDNTVFIHTFEDTSRNDSTVKDPSSGKLRFKTLQERVATTKAQLDLAESLRHIKTLIITGSNCAAKLTDEDPNTYDLYKYHLSKRYSMIESFQLGDKINIPVVCEVAQWMNTQNERPVQIGDALKDVLTTTSDTPLLDAIDEGKEPIQFQDGVTPEHAIVNTINRIRRFNELPVPTDFSKGLARTLNKRLPIMSDRQICSEDNQRTILWSAENPDKKGSKFTQLTINSYTFQVPNDKIKGAVTPRTFSDDDSFMMEEVQSWPSLVGEVGIAEQKAISARFDELPKLD